jgi:cyclic pyranopterin phosphate synthase
MNPKDIWSRPLQSLRLSVTDRCNLRCFYCMPEHSYQWLPRKDVLSFEEISVLVDSFCALGVTRLRLTGGEPLLRHDLDRLVKMLSEKPAIQDLAMTTNGVLLEERLDDLLKAGLGRVTISLDTLKRDRFSKLTRRDDLPKVLRAIEATASKGVPDLKIDTVVMRGVNDDELFDMIDYGRSVNAEVRFIEYMDVGGATQWS